MGRFPILLTLMSGLCLCACNGATRGAQASRLEVQPASSNAVRAWEVASDGQVIGVVVLFEEFHGSRSFYSVRNQDQQELGLIDEHGRAWRYVVHESEPDWLVTGTVFDGVRAILGVGPEAAVYEVPIATLLREAL